jgi:subtilisin family serine protease
MDSIDLIVILHDSVNNDPVRVNYFMTQLGVRELGMTTPSNALLWRMPICNSTCIDGESVTWNGKQEAVERTGPRIKGVSMSENWGIVAQPIRYGDVLPPLPRHNLRTLSKCSTSINYTMLECNRGLEGVRVAVLDAGASISISAPLFGYIDHLKSWNFVDDTRNYEDKHGHGNFCANIIRTFMASAASIKAYSFFA